MCLRTTIKHWCLSSKWSVCQRLCPFFIELKQLFCLYFAAIFVLLLTFSPVCSRFTRSCVSTRGRAPHLCSTAPPLWLRMWVHHTQQMQQSFTERWLQTEKSFLKVAESSWGSSNQSPHPAALSLVLRKLLSSAASLCMSVSEAAVFIMSAHMHACAVFCRWQRSCRVDRWAPTRRSFCTSWRLHTWRWTPQLYLLYVLGSWASTRLVSVFRPSSRCTTPWRRRTLTPFCRRCPTTLKTSWKRSLWRSSDWWRTRSLWWADMTTPELTGGADQRTISNLTSLCFREPPSGAMKRLGPSSWLASWEEVQLTEAVSYSSTAKLRVKGATDLWSFSMTHSAKPLLSYSSESLSVLPSDLECG